MTNFKSRTVVRHQVFTWWVGLCALVVVALAGGQTVAAASAAHAAQSVAAANSGQAPSLVKSEPPNNGIVRKSPARIAIRFDQPITKAEVSVVVGGQPLVVSQPELSGNNVVVQVPAGVPVGDYQVSYSASNKAEQTTKGAFTFAYSTDPGDTGAPTPTESQSGASPITGTGGASNASQTPVPDPAASQGGINSIMWVIAGLLVLGVALVVTVQLQKKQRLAAQNRVDGNNPEHL